MSCQQMDFPLDCMNHIWSFITNKWLFLLGPDSFPSPSHHSSVFSCLRFGSIRVLVRSHVVLPTFLRKSVTHFFWEMKVPSHKWATWILRKYFSLPNVCLKLLSQALSQILSLFTLIPSNCHAINRYQVCCDLPSPPPQGRIVCDPLSFVYISCQS